MTDRSMKPECLTEETWKDAGNAGVYITELSNGDVEVSDGAGYTFQREGAFTIKKAAAEQVLRSALDQSKATYDTGGKL